MYRAAVIISVLISFVGCKKEPLTDECSVFVGKWKCVGYRLYENRLESPNYWPVEGSYAPLGKDFFFEFEESGFMRIKEEGCIPSRSRISEVFCESSSPSSTTTQLFVTSRIISKYTTQSEDRLHIAVRNSDTLVTGGLDLAYAYPAGYSQVSPVFYFVRQ